LFWFYQNELFWRWLLAKSALQVAQVVVSGKRQMRPFASRKHLSIANPPGFMVELTAMHDKLPNGAAEGLGPLAPRRFKPSIS
jgi:hypothetical protein